ncbi:hydrolase [Serpentinicella sp. ANB-PHB4]|uniref:hydrolase n=1 Tax=Serpentinicella sp. ANB-PHB4 TaxID=3074076 RepID=UPI0028620E53|nr:hydrolase [Serpentinicella sp. ANB-PHB4]MDR5659260.1 hydrolase [Serpentinicella sp. ANB-PHB4]
MKVGKVIPEVEVEIRGRIVEMPKVIYSASGIKILGTRIKSLLFSTDVAVIENNNADAVIAVYPFTPQLSITEAILDVASVPVFCGVGGGVTTGHRSADIALQAELKGAYGVVVNAPIDQETVKDIRDKIDIPIVLTVVSEHDNYREKIEAGVKILNVSGGADTAKIVKKIRKSYPDFPIIATGGPTDESIAETIEAGANAITYTPPTGGEIFSEVMVAYREEKDAESG